MKNKKKNLKKEKNGMTKSKKVIVNKKDYEDIADCIKTDQVPASIIVEYFSDKKFHKWYKKNYLNDR